ncbi:hypothetical protein E3O25_09880 [Cryobacterium sp. TMT1-3]|uniref:Uncharacterized protein n=1 Tax=Cryobacterium luteum TaxID=1424661 RepID=A0A1H8C869_9MICO|nr:MULTISPECIES: hypothetical protein [Cryobacterium]TFB89288.1 hypothetical protein E3O10_10465 [Cryobacterium luteum]TFC27402.1 hypothetical protein E3O25_09880 [Cryobacterium sp. TMT1-3]SEM91255.1 hypothetical protein SAMN05216281_102286 [Cryobacterium luteum]
MTRLPSSSIARVSSGVGAVFLTALAGFQLALALGAPWGRAAYGGATEHPTKRMRASSAVASVVWAVIALVVLRRGGHEVRRVVPGQAVPAVMWTAVGLLAVGVVLNTLTPSRLERMIWAPVSLVLLVTTTATELAARPRR